jgi:hypothetical protein
MHVQACMQQRKKKAKCICFFQMRETAVKYNKKCQSSRLDEIFGDAFINSETQAMAQIHTQEVSFHLTAASASDLIGPAIIRPQHAQTIHTICSTQRRTRPPSG